MYLGLDLGTSGLRALLIDEDQNTVAVQEVSYDVTHAHPGWSEQDPQVWITATEAALDRLKNSNPNALSGLRGIGVSGHMHGATLIDADGAPLRPCILWNDTRSHAEAAALDGHPDMRRITGNIVFPGFTAPKLAWVRANEPKIFAKIDKVLLPKDYLGLWLTGEAVSEMSDAAGTSWLDTGARAWSEEALEASSMRLDQMPRLIEGSEVAGTLKSELAAWWQGVAQTMQRRPAGRGRCRRVRGLCHWARLASSSLPEVPTRRIRQQPCIHSVMPCRALGIRWVSCSLRPIA